ncbi:MAG TPA: 4Fe-4S dicluster domain-containing protein, partial [Kofleriaceae bacterium]|nr:4Fe-4S dicluster domain-containing protein [Kofleriaceae bacterium]
MVVESHEGRPTKLEGNPDHPASLGATRAIEQAAVLSLYDPQRITAIRDRGEPAPWSAILHALASAARVHVIVEPTASPITAELIRRLRAKGNGVTAWSPFGLRASLEGNRLAFGRPLQTQLDLRDAEVIVALDVDLASDIVHARRIADRRRVVDASSQMNRVYAIEASYTPTGIIADHRFRARPSEIEAIAAELHGVKPPRSWVAAIARDLERAGSRGVVVVGEHHAPVVHALVAAINAKLGSRAVGYTEPLLVDSDELRAADLYLVLGGDPIRTAPHLALDPSRAIYCGVFENDTAAACRFVVPGQHDLERWGIERARDGTLTPIQPLIEPIYDGKSTDEVLFAVLGDAPRTARSRVVDAWHALSATAFETALARGVDGPAAPLVEVTLAWQPQLADRHAPALELEIRPHPFVHDGRYATNPWLLEIPDPITKVTWDGVARMSGATAASLGVETQDVIAIGSIELPVAITPEHADGVVSVYAGVGPNVFVLAPGAVEVTRTDRTIELAITQGHWTLEDRPILMSSSLRTLGELRVPRGPVPSVIPDFPQSGPQWAMSIDLTTCTGCSACVMACSAENNIPVVGKTQVANSREMHWLRIDRYVDDGGAVAVQPVACQHCEKAPCEYVCPVEATT